MRAPRRPRHTHHPKKRRPASTSRPSPAALPPTPPTPARVRPPSVPGVPLSPAPGRWLWTCRAGFEAFLYEELSWLGGRPKLLGSGLVESGPVPAQRLAFARAGFRVAQVMEQRSGWPEAEAVGTEVERLWPSGPLVLQAWAPDTEVGNRLVQQVQALAEAVAERLRTSTPDRKLALGEPAERSSRERLVQLLAVDEERLALGEVGASEALSTAPGGRRRMRREGGLPSRAGLKLEEALAGLPVAPGRGEVCVDLGAAPGGWTARLVARGAKVIAVDPANLSPELSGHPKVKHFKDSAFAFEPDEPADWLFCDMAWRPLEVAQLLAKWARRGWALQLVANIKLPMRDKLPILHRVRHTLEGGGWKGLRMRQLYHDRDEVTVTATRGG